MSESRDPGVYLDRMNDVKQEVEKSLRDLRRSLEALSVGEMTGMKILTVPVFTQVAKAIGGADLSPATLCVMSALGLGVGLVSGILNYRDKARKLEGACDYSYLLHMGREWKGRARNGSDYNYALCRDLEEFIND